MGMEATEALPPEMTFRTIDTEDRPPLPIEWPDYPQRTLARFVRSCPGSTLADWHRDTGGDRTKLFVGEGMGFLDEWVNPVRLDQRCTVCGWRQQATGHLKDQPCPDLLTYKYLAEELKWPVRQIAAFYDRSYSW